MSPCGCNKIKTSRTGAVLPTRPASGYEPPRITLQAARPAIGTDYMQFIYKRDRVEILYMAAKFVRGQAVLVYSDSECLHFSEYPEVQQIHSGLGWNLEELTAWSRLVSEDREFMSAVQA